MSSLINLLQRYSGAPPESAAASVREDFDQVAQHAPPDHLANGLNDAFRSDQTPPFGNMLGSLFGASNGEQKAGILNQLLGSIAPGVLASGVLGEFTKYLGSSGTLTPQQADQVPAEAVQELAQHAQQHDPSIIDRASDFYAQHPTLVQALGAGSLALIMSRMSSRQS
jgi:hypothetical protein